MKKLLLSIILCFIAFVSFSQTAETVTEEKSSNWVLVTAISPPVVRKANSISSTNSTRVVTRPANTAANNQKPPVQKSSETFNKTNQKVKRFKKS
jgi:hypothetical protein